MRTFSRIVLASAFLSGFALSAMQDGFADIGPRRPIRRVEVDDPERYLAMRDETVQVTIDARRTARVEASFHFENVQPAWRETLVMRLGFPALAQDAPLQDFSVAQAVYTHGGPAPQLEAVPQIVPQPSGGGPADPLKAQWKTWPLVFQGHEGPPSSEDVSARVRYTQRLTPLPNKTWRFTYVLRSGAPWKDPIGAADIRVVVNGGKIVSASPKGAVVKGNSITWSLRNVEPTEDVVVVVR